MNSLTEGRMETAHRPTGKVRWILLLAAVFVSTFSASSAALAIQIDLPPGSYYAVWGHSSRVNSQAIVGVVTYSSWMDVEENSGYTMLINGASVQCSRSRVFGDDWTLLYSIQSVSSPFPIATYNQWYFDARYFSTVTDGYPMRGYYQVSSEFSGGACGYGGGVGWERSAVGWSHWSTST